MIVWDDFIYEPITSLTHPSSGLFTPNSFATAETTEAPLRFEWLDGVIVISHLQWLKRAMAEDGASQPFEMSQNAFKYDLDRSRPAAYIPNPHARGLPIEITRALNADLLADQPAAAEYHPQDLIFWVGGTGEDDDTS